MSDLSRHFVALALQGDLRPAIDLFADLAEPGASDAALARRFARRFVENTEPLPDLSGDPLLDGVVAAYRDYWRKSLITDRDASAGERELQAALAALLAGTESAGIAPPAADAVTEVHRALRQRGFGAVLERAPPLLDLIVWRGEQRQKFQVELTDETRQVEVVFLSGFASLGWKDFASLGLTTTTGWVEGRSLFCVEWAYAPDSERFRVSYLKHEARHLADFDRFPGLPAADLEYRAKLTELAFATNTLPRLLDEFGAQAAADADSPHARANWRLMQALAAELSGAADNDPSPFWVGIDPSRVHRAARRLLEEDTRRLLAQHEEAN